MSLVILPTFEIVAENASLDPLFKVFMRGGVREVIQDAVYLTSFRERSPTLDYYRSLQSYSCALTDHVLKCFDEYTQNRFDDSPQGELSRMLNVDNYFKNIGELEFVCVSIADAVRIMMEDLFRTQLYNVVEEGSYWRERDLYVQVETFPFGGHRRGF